MNELVLAALRLDDLTLANKIIDEANALDDIAVLLAEVVHHSLQVGDLVLFLLHGLVLLGSKELLLLDLGFGPSSLGCHLAQLSSNSFLGYRSKI